MPANFDIAPLQEAAAHEIAEGLRACQLAVAREGELVFVESFGDATDAMRFGVASATKHSLTTKFASQAPPQVALRATPT